ncbi:TPA: hypothetical protein DCX16_05245, partial [bacterium]|nr:hypothetical protein [bacterium]
MNKNKEFELRYAVRPFKRENKKIEEDLNNKIKKNLKLLENIPNRLPIMTYYEEILGSSSRIDELKKAKENGKKIVGVFCNFVPEELLYAAGLVPIRLCAGSYDTIYPAEEILPRDICQLIKSSVGFKLLGLSYFELCDLVIIPTTCDGKKKLGEMLNSFVPVLLLELPNRKNLQRAKDFWINEVKTLKKKLEKFARVKITRQGLKHAIQTLQKRQAVFRKFYELRKNNQGLNGRDTFLVIQAAFYDEVSRWIEKTQTLCDQLVSNKKSQESRIRLLLTGAPIIWPNYKLLNIIEESGAIIVADELCSGTRMLYDPVGVDEWTEKAMITGIAYRYLLPSTCPCFTESNDRMDRILDLLNEFNVEGV